MLRALPLLFLCCLVFACSSEDAASESDGSDVSGVDALPELLEESEPEVIDVQAEEIPEEPLLWEDLLGQGPVMVDIIGVSTHMAQGEGANENRDFEFARYKELGGAAIREDYHWHKIEPADDAWDFARVATQVAMAKEADMRVLPMLAYKVDWAMADESYSSIDPAEYGEFAGRLAEEYCDSIKQYEMWNEENIPRFWAPKPDPHHYGLMLKAAYSAVKAACPDALVSIGGLASYSPSAFFDRWGFLRALGEAHPDIADFFDVLAIHPYSFLQYDPPEHDKIEAAGWRSESQTAMTDIAREILAGMGKPDAPIWYTEMGWPSYQLSEEQVGRFLARSVLLAARDGVDQYYWYTFYDAEPITTGVRPHEHYFGLFGWPSDPAEPRRPKPAWFAMKALADLLGQASFARDLGPALELPNDVYALAFVTGEGRRIVAAWDGREKPDVLDDWTDEGGPETSHDLVLPLPEGLTSITVYDVSGDEVETINVDGPFERRLTTSVVYLVLD
jgi:hypothetical protein